MLKQTLLNCFLLTSCLFSQPKNNSEFPSQLLICNQDLPKGWFQTSEYDLSADSSNQEYLVQFGLSETLEDSDLISHHIVIAYDSEKADEVFKKQETLWFSHEIKAQVEVHFEPIRADERYRLICEERSMGVVGCSFLQQHGNTVSLVLATIDGKNFLLNQFEVLIKKLDERLHEYKALTYYGNIQFQFGM